MIANINLGVCHVQVTFESVKQFGLLKRITQKKLVEAGNRGII